jgi:hypothetical protein
VRGAFLASAEVFIGSGGIAAWKITGRYDAQPDFNFYVAHLTA